MAILHRRLIKRNVVPSSLSIPRLVKNSPQHRTKERLVEAWEQATFPICVAAMHICMHFSVPTTEHS
jgi:hypothetical protein